MADHFIDRAVDACRAAQLLEREDGPATSLVERITRGFRELARHAGDSDLPAGAVTDLEYAAEKLGTALELAENGETDAARRMASAAEQRLQAADMLIDSTRRARQATQHDS